MNGRGKLATWSATCGVIAALSALSAPGVAWSDQVPAAYEGAAQEAARELDRLIASLGDANASARRAAATALSAVDAQAVPAVTDRLERLRRERSDGSVAAAVRDARRADPTGDLLAELARAGAQDALTVVALARALEHAGTPAAARHLVKLAGDYDGVLRPELGRAVKALGERAVGALLEARNAPSVDVRKWAIAQLEAMNKRIPADAVQTRSNDVLADVLRAFAASRDMDALPVVLSFVTSDRAVVRMAARESVERYGADATTKLREAYANLTGKIPAETWLAPDLARQLFAAYDRVRTQDVSKLVEEGLAKQRDGDIDGAIAAFDRVLARDPLAERRADMVAAYVLHAQSRATAEGATALASYRKAKRLDPEGHRSEQIEAAITFLEAEELRARGITDARAYRRAVALDPGNAAARAVLDQLESNADQREERMRRLAAATVVLALGVVGTVLFGGKRENAAAASRPN